MKTCLLSFSGGLDSTLCAWLLKPAYKVELGYVRWHIPGSSFGDLQHQAAVSVAHELGLPLLPLATVQCPPCYQAKWSWVQAAASMVMWHAAYPIKRYDSVAFGIQPGSPGTWQRNAFAREFIESLAKLTNYDGEILYPVQGMDRDEEWAMLPKELRRQVWCCNIPTAEGKPCGQCYKCKHDGESNAD